jgi:methionyl-tRNA formyltransferase
MRLVFMGTSEFAVPALHALYDAGHAIVAVVTRPDRPRRRQSDPPAPSPVKKTAIDLGLPILDPASVREAGFADRLAALAPDVMVVVAYGQILPADMLRLPPRGCINLHASLLPKYRGAAPIARALMVGEKITGVTTMQMDAGVDTGDILLQRDCPIGIEDTTATLTPRLAAIGAPLLVETIDRLGRGALDPRRQDAAGATLAPPLRKEDGRIDWNADAGSIANQVRGCNPWPVARTTHRGAVLQILRAEVSFRPPPETRQGAGVPPADRPAPGQVQAGDRGRLIVACRGDSRLEILELRFPGGKSISARDAVNGRLVRAGEILGAPVVR